MSDPERFIESIREVQGVADELTPEEAQASFDGPTLQEFWRDWPRISSWAGALWRLLNEDLEHAARPPEEPDLDEVGGEGGG